MEQKVCAFPECGRPFASRGYCQTHARQDRNGIPLRPIWDKKRPICSYEGCGRPHSAHGYCKTHSEQLRLNKPLTPITNKPKRPEICSFEGCPRPHAAYGYCSSHNRQLANGESLRELLPYRPTGTQRKPPSAPAPDGMKWCFDCQEFLTLDSFSVDNNRTNSYCKPCMNIRILASNRGLALIDAALLRATNICQCCGADASRGRYGQFHVDHDHWTDEVRGVLCSDCNHLLGFADNRVERLLSGADYLERYAGLIRFYAPKWPRTARFNRSKVPDGCKWCPECAEILALDEFGLDNGKARVYCRPCARILDIARRRQTTPEHIRALRSRGHCEICGTTDSGSRPFHVDHNHTTNVIRGLLCNGCNLMIGRAGDDPAVLRNAAGYIRRYGIDYITRYAASRRAA